MGCCTSGKKEEEKGSGKTPAATGKEAPTTAPPGGSQKPPEPKPPTKPESKSPAKPEPPVVLPPDPVPSILPDIKVRVISVAGDLFAEVKVDAEIAMGTLYSRIRNEISNPEKHRFDLRLKGGKALEEGPKKLSEFGVTEDVEVTLYPQKA